MSENPRWVELPPQPKAPSWRTTAIVLGGLVVLQLAVNLLAMWIGG